MRTPGKWWVVKFEDVLCIDSAEQGIARINPIINPNAEDDARYITTACNLHDELVEALKLSKAWLKGITPLSVKPQDVVATIDKALAKAKEAQDETS